MIDYLLRATIFNKKNDEGYVIKRCIGNKMKAVKTDYLLSIIFSLLIGEEN